jgi:pimeloyl-ACP methyl ester carboxylesterase
VDQSEDVAAVIDWIDARVSLPVWVLGMSLGSYSATNSAIRLNRSLDGFALCSASTAPTGGPRPNGILDMALERIAMPALIVGHRDDACPGTPPEGVPRIAEALTAADPIAQRVFSGGDPARSGPCGPLAPHGYLGIEDDVVTYMAGVIGSP